MFVKDVLDLWYSGYFLFLAVGKLWKQQEDESSWQRWNKKAAVRVHNDKELHRNRWDKQASWQSRETQRCCWHHKGIQRNSSREKEGHHRGCVLPREDFKHFKEKEKFIQMVGKLKIHKSTIVFKINLFKLIEKHPKLLKSSVTLTFLKNYFKDIKQICKENSSEFE